MPLSVFSRVFTLGVLVAGTSAGAAGQSVDASLLLRQRLELLGEGAYHALHTTEFAVPSSEEGLVAAGYARSAIRCLGKDVAPGYVPASARSVVHFDQVVVSESRFVLTPDGFRLYVSPQSGSDSDPTDRLLIRTQADLFREYRRGDWSSPTYRSFPGAQLVENADGVLLTYLRLRRQLLSLLEHEPLSTVESSDEGLHVWAWDLTEGWDWGRLEVALPRNGVIESAQRAEVRWNPGSREVDLRWVDCEDFVILEARLKWDDRSALPTSIRERDYLAGSPFLKRRVLAKLVEIPPQDLPTALREEWDPESLTTRVVDRRFGDDRAPIEMAAKGESPSAAALLLNQFSGDPWTSFESLSGEGANSDWAPYVGALSQVEEELTPAAMGLAVRPATFELGRRALGSRHPLAFEVRNASSEFVTFGRPEVSCGCLDPQLSHTTLAPGEIGVLRALQEVQSTGPARHLIRVPATTASGRQSPLELHVSYEGVAGFASPSKIVDLGVVDGSARSVGATFRVLELGCTEQESDARAAVTGHLDGELFGVADDAELAGVVRLKGELQLTEPALFGILEAEAVVSSGLCDSDSASRLLTLVANRPMPHVARWPDCVLVVRGQGAGELAFEGVTIVDVELDGELEEAGFSAGILGESANSRLVVTAPDGPQGGQQPIQGFCLVTSSHGIIRVAIYGLP